MKIISLLVVATTALGGPIPAYKLSAAWLDPNDSTSPVKLRVRYWDSEVESFKFAEVHMFDTDTCGDVAYRAAEATQGAIAPDWASLFLDGQQLYDDKLLKYFLQAICNGGELTVGYPYYD